jgi:uncharacterized RmlC-like cupin family protein
MSSKQAGRETDDPRCRLVQAGVAFTGKQGLSYAPAISAETVGAAGLHMQVVTIPPGAWAKAHKHEGHETAVHVLSGRSGTFYGERLEHHVVAGPGDFIYIAAGVPHLPYNLSDTEPCTAVIARTDPNEQESVVLLPELDAIHKPARN